MVRLSIALPGTVLGLLLLVSSVSATSFTPNLHLQSAATSDLFFIKDVEPAIRVDSTGRIFVSAIHGVPGGTDLFQVASNGLSYAYRGEPDGLPVFNPTGLAPGGGDTDLAMGSFSATNPGPLLITSLNLGTVYTSQTSDDGLSYTPGGNAAGAFVGVDRQWNNAQGGLERYNVVHDAATDNIEFSRSLDGGLTWVNGTATTAAIAGTSTLDNELGTIVVDQTRHILYNVFVSTANLIENANSLPFHTVWVAKSTNDGLTWGDTIVYNGPTTASYNHLFPAIAIDAAGNVFVAWSDDVNVFMAYSANQGTTWSRPIQVTNTSGGYRTHIFPWLAAGGNGGLDVVYYETTGANPNLSTDKWVVGFAQNVNVIKSPTKFSYAVASDHIIHTGQVCESGLACDSTQPGNRDLADDFQIAVDPQGFANIAYTDDHDTTIQPQTYFTKQSGGNSVGAPVNFAAVIAMPAASSGCIASGSARLGSPQFRLKAPDAWSPGWLTVIQGRRLLLAGYLTSFTALPPATARFSGMTVRGMPFSGTLVNGRLNVSAGMASLNVSSTNVQCSLRR